MTREKKNSDWDDLKFMLDRPQETEQDRIFLEEAPETPADDSTPTLESVGTDEVSASVSVEVSEPAEPSATVETTDGQEKSDDESASEKKTKKASSKSAEKDADVKKTRASRAAKKEAADDDAVKPAPKRARGRRSAASEKELEVSKTFGDVISQIANLAERKRSSAKKASSVEAEPQSEPSEDVAETAVFESTDAVVSEPVAAPDASEAFSVSQEELAFATILKARDEEPGETRPVVDDSLPVGFWSNAAELERESLEDILWSFKKQDDPDFSESVKTTEPAEESMGFSEDFVAAKVSCVEPAEPSEPSATDEEPPRQSKNEVDGKKEDDDFWGFDDSLDISWGTSPASDAETVDEPERRDDFVEEREPEPTAVETSDVSVEPEEVAFVAPEPEKMKKLETVDDVDFSDPDDLSSFFSFSTSDDLGFAPRKKPSKSTKEKPGKALERDAEPVRAAKKADADRKFEETSERGAEESYAPRNNRRRERDEIEEPRESRAPRDNRRRDYDDVEEPRESRVSRDNRRRDYDEVEEPRESRASRDARRRRDFDDVEEPRESRAPRDARRRDFDEVEEPRASRFSRDARRRRDFDEIEEPSEPRAPRDGRRRDFDDVEESRESRAPRDARRRDYDEIEEPRESRAPRDARRRDYDEIEEPRESRAPRNNRRRTSDEVEEPRESRAPREDRRRVPDASADSTKEADAERKPERVLPSWDEAIGYVVNYNLSRRARRGRGK